MAKYDLVLTNNIDCKDVYSYLDKVLSKDRTLFLTATQNLKRIRKQHIQMKEDSELITFSELKEKVYEGIRKGPKFLSRADQKFVLNQVIKSMFKGERQTALYKIRNDLFELYEFMLGEEISGISEETIKQIANDFTNTERDIFNIYNKYFDTLMALKQGNTPVDIELEDFPKGKTLKLLCEVFNTNLFAQVDDYDTIIFDGFLFFNEEQRKLLSDAKFKGKNLVFIVKQMKSDSDSFLMNELLLPLQQELGIKFNLLLLNSGEEEKENAITFVRDNYLDFDIETDIELGQGFKFVEPFASRDRELNYIINCISKFIKSKCNDNRELICKTLANDIAVVIANEKEKYEHQLNVLLKDRGVFFLDTESEIIDQFDIKQLKDVIYARVDFVEAKIKNKAGKLLSRQEKIVAFKKLYKGINISQKTRSFINYPIGQYILEIYRIINEGMNCEGYKKILYSNWYYNVGLDTVKYDRFIKEFHYIEPYLHRKKQPQEWVKELEKLKKDKANLTNNIEYRFHPLQDISNETLDFLIQSVADTTLMVNKLSKVFGNINKHLQALKENFLLEEILENTKLANEFEIEVIRHLKEVIDNINKSNLITNIDSKYFADNIKNMLTDYEREKAESSADNLTLNVVNMENMQKFDLTFFCMLEEDKYPRPYRVNFPYSENIIEILENPKYEIEHRPSFIKTLDYHIRLEKYLFLNVLDITKQQMIITQTEEENGKDLRNSIYVEDIFSMFKQDIKYTKLKEAQTKVEENYNPIKNVNMEYSDKEPVRLTDLCSYFLCPKLYYYISNGKFANEISYDNEWKLNIFIPSLIFYKTMYKLGMLGKQNKTIYSLNNTKLIDTIEACLNEAMVEELAHFDFISNYDKKDIKNRAEIQINSFIERNIYGKDILNFCFDLSNAEKIKVVNEMGKEITIEIDSCLKIINAQNGYSMNYDISSQLDFLVKGAGGDTYDLAHFKEIFEKLSEKNPYDDRMALINFMFFKINVQLNSPKYRQDGLQRLKELSRYIMKQTDNNYIPSSYCRYCKFEGICKSKERGAV